VGIGTASPSAKLQLDGGMMWFTGVNANSANIEGLGIFGGTTAQGIYARGDATGTDNDFSIMSTGFIKLGSNNIERMRISSAGNVGIGVTNPLSPLCIEFNDAGTSQASFKGITLANSNGTGNNGAVIAFGQTGSSANSFSRIGVIYEDRTGNSEDQSLFFGTLGGGAYSEKMRITSDGKVGIGETNVEGQLHLKHNIPVNSEIAPVQIVESSGSHGQIREWIYSNDSTTSPSQTPEYFWFEWLLPSGWSGTGIPGHLEIEVSMGGAHSSGTGYEKLRFYSANTHDQESNDSLSKGILKQLDFSLIDVGAYTNELETRFYYNNNTSYTNGKLYMRMKAAGRERRVTVYSRFIGNTHSGYPQKFKAFGKSTAPEGTIPVSVADIVEITKRRSPLMDSYTQLWIAETEHKDNMPGGTHNGTSFILGSIGSWKTVSCRVYLFNHYGSYSDCVADIFISYNQFTVNILHGNLQGSFSVGGWYGSGYRDITFNHDSSNKIFTKFAFECVSVNQITDAGAYTANPDKYGRNQSENDYWRSTSNNTMNLKRVDR
jgi:hypothetical protein